jgi:Domain of unknown function (DUF5911)
MSNTAIADHALLSDRHSTAFVDRSGSVEWLSFPRFDSPSVFGRLLGADAGHWSISPSGDWTSSRRYEDPTLVLETTFTTATGVLVLTDLLGPWAEWRTSARHECPVPPDTTGRLHIRLGRGEHRVRAATGIRIGRTASRSC